MFIRSCLDLQSLWSHIISHILLSTWCGCPCRLGGILEPSIATTWFWRHPLTLKGFHVAQSWAKNLSFRMMVGLPFWLGLKKTPSWFLDLWALDFKSKSAWGLELEREKQVLGVQHKIRGIQCFILIRKCAPFGVGKHIILPFQAFDLLYILVVMQVGWLDNKPSVNGWKALHVKLTRWCWYAWERSMHKAVVHWFAKMGFSTNSHLSQVIQSTWFSVVLSFFLFFFLWD